MASGGIHSAWTPEATTSLENDPTQAEQHMVQRHKSWHVYLVHWFVLIGCFGAVTVAHAKHELLVVHVKGTAQICHQQCQLRKNWLALPRHRVLSVGDWVSLPKGSLLSYRTMASTAPIQTLKGPQKHHLQSVGHVAVSQKLARLWRRVVRLLRGRSQAGTGATRAPRQIVSHPAFVDLMSPRNEERWQRPSHLRWLARDGYQRYRVRITRLLQDGREQPIATQEVTCHTRTCRLPLKSIPLQRGIRYVWQVQLLHHKHAHAPYPSYGVYFRLLPKAEARRLQKHMAALSPTPQRPLHRALLLLQRACFGEALAVLAKHKALNPVLRQQLRDAVACAICRPWSIPKSHRRQSDCQCDDDPGRESP